VWSLKLANSAIRTFDYYFNAPSAIAVFDMLDQLCEQFQCGRALIVSRNITRADIPPGRFKDNYYLIRAVDQLEQALMVELPDRDRRSLARMTLPLHYTGQRRAPVMYVVQHLIQLQDHPPQREVQREPVPNVWEERLNAEEGRKRKREEEDEEITCIICLDKDPVIMLAPCMHQCLCDVCVREIMERDDQQKNCPVCREEIKDIYKPIL
jgi:hypothetical protein